MSDLSQVTALIQEQGASFQQWKSQLDDVQARLDEAELKSARAPFTAQGTGTATPKPEQWLDVKSKQLVPVLSAEHSLAALDGRKADTPSMGRILRGIIMGGKADDNGELAAERKALGIASDVTGGYTVPSVLSSQWIDALRAAMVLTQAGARTFPMDAGSVTLARLTADPEISWKAENAAIPEASPTFGAVTLNAKTCVCLVKLSLELSQDSANIEQILQTSLTAAMARAIDDAGMNGVSTGSASAPSGLFDLVGRNTVTSIGAPTTWNWLIDGMYELMLDNVPAENIGALVAHPAVWRKMRKLASGIASDNTPLQMPAEVAALPKLWTTAAPLAGGTTAKAMIADWRDLVFGVRRDINFRVLSESFLGSNLQIAVLAYARVDFAATRPASFCSLEGITV